MAERLQLRDIPRVVPKDNLPGKRVAKVLLGEAQPQLQEMRVPYDVRIRASEDNSLTVATVHESAGKRSRGMRGEESVEATATALRTLLGHERSELRGVRVGNPVFGYTEDGTRTVRVRGTDEWYAWYSTVEAPTPDISDYALAAEAVTDAFRFRSAWEDEQT